MSSTPTKEVAAAAVDSNAAPGATDSPSKAPTPSQSRARLAPVGAPSPGKPAVTPRGSGANAAAAVAAAAQASAAAAPAAAPAPAPVQQVHVPVMEPVCVTASRGGKSAPPSGASSPIKGMSRAGSTKYVPGDDIVDSEIEDKVGMMFEYNIKVPGSLRSVAPFLEEAQSILRKNAKEGKSLRRMYVALSCIDHAVDLVSKFALKLDEEAMTVLDKFGQIREWLHSHLVGTQFLPDNVPSSADQKGKLVKKNERPSAEQALIAEANATLELGEEQLAAHMHQSAARNFHTATVYFKVLQSIAPQLTAEIQGKLQYSACRTRMCSHLIENFVHEHFEGRICSDYYDIIGDGGRLGEGSYGSVYLCRNKKSGDSFACKVIGLSRINSHYLRKLHLEIAIMKEVDHPNIIRIHEVFFGTRTVYLIMELCSGGELFAHLTSHYKKGFEEEHAALLMRDMLSSVRYLHTKGIVHRDIKLENFLFEVNTTDSRLKLIDFGLSKHCSESELMHQVVGSAYYTAPEVLESNYDHRCDIWSLGVVAYMLLCGAPPFYGDSSEQIHEMIRTREAQYPAKRLGHISEHGIAFLKGMLTKDPQKRISMEEALNHPFIDSANNYVISEKSAMLTRRKSTIPPPSTDVVASLGQFVRAGKAKKLVLNSIAFALTPKQIAEMIDEFNSIDADKDGVITMIELQAAINKINEREGSGMLSTALPTLEALGVDQGVEMNYSEFIAAAMCRRIEIDDERIQVAFEAVDEEGTGFLNKEAIKRIMGADAEDEDIENVMQEIDLDKDGRIDYKEFAKYWKQLQLSMTPKKRVVNAIEKVQQSLKVISRMGSGLSAGLSGSASHGGKSTSLLPSINAGSSSFMAQTKKKPDQGAAGAEKTTPRGTGASPRGTADNTPAAGAPAATGLTGAFSGMMGAITGAVGNASGSIYHGATNADDPQSLGRKQWTQLRVQKLEAIKK